VKIAFSMRHPGALRNYASTVDELARRGHRIHLIFTRRDKLGESGLLVELRRAHPGITSEELGETGSRPWLTLARSIRAIGDFARYRAPQFRDAQALRDRAARHLPSWAAGLPRSRWLRLRSGRAALRRMLGVAERAIPPDPSVIRLLEREAPDLLLVTPLVDFGSDQEEFIKAARTLGIPSGLCVHSWDNLTNKGLIHVRPDRVFVWNEAQKREAVTLHGVAPGDVVCTGAPCYDQWFSRRPSTSREEFCRKVGLPSEKPYLLYLCSSQFIAPREADFVKRWVTAIRSSPDPRVRDAGILVRPHPRNDMTRWRRFDLTAFSDVVLWPLEGANPVDDGSRSDYFDSLSHSAAAVGINTSALIEAGIAGRQVYTVRAPEYVTTQEGTLHFHYLLSEHGGLLHMAPTLEEHAAAVGAALSSTSEDQRRLRAFVEGFVRPRGLDAPATPVLADAIEQLARVPVTPRTAAPPMWVYLVRRLLYPLATRMKPGRRAGVNVAEPDAAEPRIEKKRFLFVMHYPGYLRYFDSVIRQLAAHGHHVDLVFDSPDKQAEGIEAVADLEGAVDVLGRMPVRGDVWTFVAHAVRGTMDYARYLHPDFADTPYLRDRMRTALPPLTSFLARRPTSGVGFIRRLNALLKVCERAIPSSRVIERFIRSRRPDAVLVTPLVTDRSPQVDVIRSAQACGIPAALCVASWDHLTTKGLIRVQPDLVSVWNEEQKAEALAYHDIPAGRIIVTGAQPFDRWFERRPTPRAEFCRKVGLPVDRPYVIFVGSTASISAPDAEMQFVRRWIAALRAVPALAEVGILVRPHPFNARHWSEADMAGVPNVAVYPHWANPVNEADRQDYFDSLHHSEAVVGINTTAMIEAAIAGRTVHSVLADEFRDTQGGTLHFRYLLAENGGFLRVAPSLPEHARQLAETLASPDIGRDACARFVRTFVRPRGIDVPTTPILVDALERLASGTRTRSTMPVWLYPLSAILWLSGAASHYPQRIWNLTRKQWRIAEKRTHHARKRLRRVKQARRATGEGVDVRRRKAG
jgi:hypothetical protein